MAHRKLKTQEAEWEVWDVRPEVRAYSLGPELQSGWLCFQNGVERRRLHPIPEAWEALDDHELAQLIDRAEAVTPVKSSGKATPIEAFRAIAITRELPRAS